ncbi:MAG: SulP family inorganic anion transporter [Brachymonas sp.]|nr:SulP family inorganic anion transporter [Brachymonas sp.]
MQQLLTSFLEFKPNFLQSMRGYSKEKLVKDVTAGLTVGVVALPLAMAFAIASGLKPEVGIFTAIIAGFLISLLGGSKVQIGGPAGAFIVIVYGIVARYQVSGLIIAVAISGVFLFLMGRFRLGSLVRFIPVAVVIGFTNGIAVLIGLSQLKDFMGMKIEKMPAEFFGVLHALFTHIHTINPSAVAIACASLAIIIVWQYFTPSLLKHRLLFHGKLTVIPGSIVALILTSIAVNVLGLDVETIGSRFGGIPSTLPKFTLPELHWDSIRFLLMPAFTLALLGAIESLLCARVADSMMGDGERHDPNQELMAQGVANLVTSFFGGMPATGTIARTVTNIKSGATSPVAGIVHALALLLVVLVAAPLAVMVPLPTLAAILVFVAWNMGEWREFAHLRNHTVPYRIILVTVFLLTVIFDLTVAVEVGLVASLLTFLYHISKLSMAKKLVPQADTPVAAAGTEVSATTAQETGNAEVVVVNSATRGLPRWDTKLMRVWQLHGALFFGSVQLLEDIQDDLPKRVLVIDFSNLLYIDSSGMEELEQLIVNSQKQKIDVVLCGLKEQPLSKARRVGLALLTDLHITDTLAQAVDKGLELMEPTGTA